MISAKSRKAISLQVHFLSSYQNKLIERDSSGGVSSEKFYTKAVSIHFMYLVHFIFNGALPELQRPNGLNQGKDRGFQG